MLIDVKNLFKIYHEGEESEVRALDGVSLSVDRGEFLAIIGQSGSGKSTLMNILGCLDIPTYGDYHLDGVDVTELSDRQLAHIRNKQIGFIFQGFNLIPALNAWENVELPLIYQGVPASKRADRVEAALERVGLAERAGHKPTEMSGGQQQRVAIARAIATQPPIIMADEPTGALDSRTGKHVLEILHGLHDDGSTIILITHDNGIAATAERVVAHLRRAYHLRRRQRGGLSVNLTQAFKIAVKSIAAKKARSALTMLGVIIGLAAVIILVSYAEGQNRQMREYYESLGNNVVNINAYSPSGRDLTKTIRDYCMEDLDDYILGLTPTVDYYDQTILKYGAKSMDSNNSNWDESPQLVMGNQDYSLCNNFTIARGRDISFLDVENYSQVCVLGSKIADTLFNYIDPVGKEITINGIPFTVVGVFEEKDPNNMSGMDRYVLIPYTVNRIISGKTEIGSFVAKAKDSATTTKAVSLLQGYLDSLLGPNEAMSPPPIPGRSRARSRTRCSSASWAALPPSPWPSAASAL